MHGVRLHPMHTFFPVFFILQRRKPEQLQKIYLMSDFLLV
jgi:hypothetical protein